MKYSLIFLAVLIAIIFGFNSGHFAMAQVVSCSGSQTACPASCVLGVNCTSCQPTSGSGLCAVRASYTPCGGCVCPGTEVACTVGGDQVAASSTSATCGAPVALSPCNAGSGEGSGTINVCGSCRANEPRYVSRQYSYPDSFEDGHIKVSGNIGSGGDFYLSSGKAIRIDGVTATHLSIGNWQGGFSATPIEDTLTRGDIYAPNLAISLNLFGELTIRPSENGDGGKLTVETLCLGEDCRTAWVSGGLATSAPVTTGYLPKFLSTGTPPVFTLTNSLILQETGKITVRGNLTATGCFGPVFVGTTSPSAPQNGERGGYTAIHGLCNGAGGDMEGSHVCSTEEILGSIRCGVSFSGVLGTFAWIVNGPPAYLALANDCNGWTSPNSEVYGNMWEFSATGGQGHLTGCNTTRVFACCK